MSFVEPELNWQCKYILYLKKQKMIKKKKRGLISYLCGRFPEDYSTWTLHNLCATIPAKELPVDLRVGSRVYHTADKKGHDTVLGVFGTSLLDDHYTDEEQRDRWEFHC